MYIMHPVPYCRIDVNLRQLSFLKMFLVVMYDSYLLKDVHLVLVNFPREYTQESMMLYI